jgi:hypothetical protein
MSAGGSRPRRRSTALAAILAAVAVVVPSVAHASVSATPDKTARVNGTVYAIAQVGSRTIIGGAFTEVGSQPRNHIAAIRADGTVDPTFNPGADGIVYALAASADGSTIYLGGTFTAVGGEARANLAAVDASGTVRADWQADTVGTSPDVLSLAVAGNYLYAAGRFTGIDGTTRKRLVALDPAGDVITTFNAAPTGTVRVVAPSSDGTRLFAGGGYNAIGGQSRVGIAELNPLTGRALPFTVTPVGSLLVAMGISPSGDRLYYGTADNRVFSYDTATSAKVWEIKNGGDTQAIAVGQDEVYLGGHFGNNLTDKVKRQWIESVSATDGHVTAWNPNLAGGSLGVWAIVATPTALLVGGEFTTANGQIQRRFARFAGTP